MTDKKTAVFRVPIITRKKFEVLEFKIEKFETDEMICNGCGFEQGNLNPKGVIKTDDGWFRLCNKCCIDQGFI